MVVLLHFNHYITALMLPPFVWRKYFSLLMEGSELSLYAANAHENTDVLFNVQTLKMGTNKVKVFFYCNTLYITHQRS